MNKHIFFDNLTAVIGSLVSGKRKFFSESFESSQIKEYLQNIHLSVNSVETGQQEIEATYLDTVLDPAYYLWQWKGPEYPTIIYHHGNNERPFDFGRFSKNSFKKILVETNKFDNVNIIAIRAPFHNGSIKDYQEKISYLSNFALMIAGSVVLIDKLVTLLKNKNPSQNIIVSGISLGGWITNLHRTYYNSADKYVPLLAGAALDHVFTGTIYKRLTGEIAKENPEVLRKVLNFEEDFNKVTDKNVYPLLGKYDQYIRYERQSMSYSNTQINVLDTGHITSLLSVEQLRDHLLNTLDS